MDVVADDAFTGEAHRELPRNFGGAEFALTLSAPNVLQQRGWSARKSEDDGVIISRDRTGLSSDVATEFTVTATKKGDDEAVLLYRFNVSVNFVPRPPEAPGNFAASISGVPDAPRATLTWTAPSGAVPADLQDYRFWSGATMSSSPDCSGADFGDWLSSPSASAGLSGVGGERTSASESAVYGECRVYALAAVNAQGAGATVRATVYIQHPPSPPRDLSATADADAVSLRWAAPASLRGAAISGYEILRESNGAGGFVSVAFSSGLTHTESNPPIATTVRYKVRAQSGAGPGEDSEAATVYVEERRRVAWSRVPINGAGGAVTVVGLESGDTVARGSAVTFSAIPVAEFYVSGWSHSDCADVGDLAAPGAAKECILTATEDLDVTATFADGGESPAAPAAFSAALVASGDRTTVTLTWQSPPNAHPPVTGWVFQRASVAAADPQACAGTDFSAQFANHDLSAAAAEFSATDSPLAYGWCHGYRMAAENLRGIGAWTGGENVYVFAPPSPPRDLSATAAADAVSLQWAAPASLRGAAISGYEILRESNGAGGFVSVAFSSGLTHLDSNARKGLTLRYKVRAESNAGPGEDSEAATVAIEGVRDCSAENRLPAAGAGSCGACADDFGEIGGYCIPSAGDSMGDFGSIPQAEICQALRLGDSDSDIRVCSGVDANDTFCIMDSADAFPCRGLLRHILKCNLGYNRVALNPFFCGKTCAGDKPKAVGSECR